MKSLFKRSLAAATGSVLALTQLALMANMNISAEEATAAANGTGTKVTVDAILNVVRSKAFQLTQSHTLGFVHNFDCNLILDFCFHIV